MVLYRCFSVWFINHVHLVIVYACMSQHVKGDILVRPCLKEISHLHERHGIALFPFLSSESFAAPPNFLPRKWGPRRLRNASMSFIITGVASYFLAADWIPPELRFPMDSRLPFHLPAHPPSISTCCCLDPEFGMGETKHLGKMIHSGKLT